LASKAASGDTSCNTAEGGFLRWSAILDDMVVSRTAMHTSNAMKPKELNALAQIDSTLPASLIVEQTDVKLLTCAYRPRGGEY